MEVGGRPKPEVGRKEVGRRTEGGRGETEGEVKGKQERSQGISQRETGGRPEGDATDSPR
jgi:hypothetical protein